MTGLPPKIYALSVVETIKHQRTYWKSMFNRIGFGVVSEVEVSSEGIAEAESGTFPPQSYGGRQAVSMTVR
jgi:hypothetical protein